MRPDNRHYVTLIPTNMLKQLKYLIKQIAESGSDNGYCGASSQFGIAPTIDINSAIWGPSIGKDCPDIGSNPTQSAQAIPNQSTKLSDLPPEDLLLVRSLFDRLPRAATHGCAFNSTAGFTKKVGER